MPPRAPAAPKRAQDPSPAPAIPPRPLQDRSPPSRVRSSEAPGPTAGGPRQRGAPSPRGPDPPRAAAPPRVHRARAQHQGRRGTYCASAGRLPRPLSPRRLRLRGAAAAGAPSAAGLGLGLGRHRPAGWAARGGLCALTLRPVEAPRARRALSLVPPAPHPLPAPRGEGAGGAGSAAGAEPGAGRRVEGRGAQSWARGADRGARWGQQAFPAEMRPRRSPYLPLHAPPLGPRRWDREGGGPDREPLPHPGAGRLWSRWLSAAARQGCLPGSTPPPRRKVASAETCVSIWTRWADPRPGTRRPSVHTSGQRPGWGEGRLALSWKCDPRARNSTKGKVGAGPLPPFPKLASCPEGATTSAYVPLTQLQVSEGPETCRRDKPRTLGGPPSWDLPIRPGFLGFPHLCPHPPLPPAAGGSGGGGRQVKRTCPAGQRCAEAKTPSSWPWAT